MRLVEAEQAILQAYDYNSTVSKCPKNNRHSARWFLVRRVGGMFTRRVQFCVQKRKTQRRMEVQQGLRLDLRRFWRRLLSDNGRERIKNFAGRMNTVAYLV